MLQQQPNLDRCCCNGRDLVAGEEEEEEEEGEADVQVEKHPGEGGGAAGVDQHTNNTQMHTVHLTHTQHK